MTLQRDLQIVILELENIRERCKFLNDQEKIDESLKPLRGIYDIKEFGDHD
jgi:hypothetical protein